MVLIFIKLSFSFSLYFILIDPYMYVYIYIYIYIELEMVLNSLLSLIIISVDDEMTKLVSSFCESVVKANLSVEKFGIVKLKV